MLPRENLSMSFQVSLSLHNKDQHLQWSISALVSIWLCCLIQQSRVLDAELLTTTQRQFRLISPASLIWVVKVQQLEAVYFTFPPKKNPDFPSLILAQSLREWGLG